MAKHAYVAYRITVTKLRNPEDLLNVGNFDGKGSDLISLFHGFLQDVQAEPLRDNKYDRYLSIPYLRPAGRTIRVKAQYGRFGLAGTLVDTTNGETTHSYNEDESPVLETRNLFASPKEGSWALFLAERYGGRGASSMILGQFKRAFKLRFEEDGFIVKSEGLVDPDAWAKYVDEADMTELQIKRWGPAADMADQFTSKSVGRIISHVKPHRGQGSFPRKVRQKLIDGEVTAQEIIGIPTRDDDEVEMILYNGEQQRSLILGETKTPILAYVIADDRDDRPTDDQVRVAMLAKVSEAKSKLNLTLKRGWEDGKWDDQALDVKLDAVREG